MKHDDGKKLDPIVEINYLKESSTLLSLEHDICEKVLIKTIQHLIVFFFLQ